MLSSFRNLLINNIAMCGVCGCLLFAGFAMPFATPLALAQYTPMQSYQTTPQAQQPRGTQTQSAPQVDAQAIANDLKGSIQRILAANEKRIPSVRDCTPDELLAYCFPYGSQAMVYVPRDASKQGNVQGGQSVYAVGALCWNFPCSGKTLFRIVGDRVIARVGSGYQPYPGSFLAMLALSEIVPDYEIKAGSDSRTLENLINTEKLFCSRGQNLGMTLVGLSFYIAPNERWQNMFGEEWSLEKCVFEELARRADQSDCDVTNQMLGLAAAVQAYTDAGVPLNDVLKNAIIHLETYQKFAYSIQNADGTWHPMFFVSKGVSVDADGVLFSTAHILRALVFSLPDERLKDPQVQRAVIAVATIISRRNANVPLSQLSYQQVEGITVGLHALKIYHERVFGSSALTEK